MILSIITINFNNKVGLDKTIQSVMNQTFRDFEWIIIDGGSTDGSAEVIAELAKKQEANISYFCSEYDGGIYQALNKGIKFAHGEYVNFMNSGDSFHDNDVLAKVFGNKQTADIIYGNAQFIFPDKSILKKYPKDVTYYWLCNDTLNHQSTFTKRCIFNTITFDTKYKILADRKFWMECKLKDYSMHHIDVVVADYDFGGFSVQNIDRWQEEHKTICEELLPQWLRTDIENSARLKRIPYLPQMEKVSSYGKGTVSVYKLLNRFFFSLMKFRIVKGTFNLIYKVIIG